MRLATLADRATLLTPSGAVDVEHASGGRFGADPMELFDQWATFRSWAADVSEEQAEAVNPALLGSPSPRPRQVFAIGLNYRDHATEIGHAGSDRAAVPPTFTKFPTCVSGPFAALRLPSAHVDWEAELVVIMAKPAHQVTAAEAWAHVAGLSVGQDYSERRVQNAGKPPQFSLGKSYPGFGPVGPHLTTPDELPDPDDVDVSCEINGERVQHDRTSSMIWPVPELISVLSGVCPLLPGDLIFTGTPAGIGSTRSPQRFLQPGDVVTTRIGGIGEIRQTCIGG